MHLRIGLLGMGLVAALVAGSTADQPESFSPGNEPVTGQAGLGSEAVDPSSRVGLSLGTAETPLSTGETAPQVAAAGQLIGFNGFDGSGSQTIALVHAGKMQIAVYHIDRSGQIRLVSSRPIDADFSLSLNVTAPLPGQIRLLGGQVK